jgi:3-dehydroquinate synthase class II
VKTRLALFVLAVLATTMFGTAAAQAPAQEKKTDAAAEKAGDTKKSDDKSKKAAARSASGTVKSASGDSIVVAGKQKGKEVEWTFGVDPQTLIRKGGKSITAADLKPGDSVSVRYGDADGKAMAQSVTVRGGGTAKKDDKKAPANPCAPKK